MSEAVHDATHDERPPSSLLKKTAVGAAGSGLILAGVVMLVTPGPGVLTIVGGFAVLAREFKFADRAVKRIRQETIDKLPASRRLPGYTRPTEESD